MYVDAVRVMKEICKATENTNTVIQLMGVSDKKACMQISSKRNNAKAIYTVSEH